MMGYFPNSTAWDCWAPDNCFKCSHWPKGEDDPACPVEAAHMLFNYDQEEGSQVESIMDLLIPRTDDRLGNKRCAMFKDKDGLSARHLRDWEKYKALMAERDRDGAEGGDANAAPVPQDRQARAEGIAQTQSGYNNDLT